MEQHFRSSRDLFYSSLSPVLIFYGEASYVGTNWTHDDDDMHFERIMKQKFELKIQICICATSQHQVEQKWDERNSHFMKL